MHVLKIGNLYVSTDGSLTDRQADAQRLIPEHVEGMRQWIASRPDYLRSDLRLVRIVTRAERADDRVLHYGGGERLNERE